jgi:hypothetical protein
MSRRKPIASAVVEGIVGVERPVTPCPFCGHAIVRYDAPEFVGVCAECGRVLPIAKQREVAK